MAISTADYVMLARIFASIKNPHDKKTVVKEFCYAVLKNHPRFDSIKFIRACYVVGLDITSLGNFEL